MYTTSASYHYHQTVNIMDIHMMFS